MAGHGRGTATPTSTRSGTTSVLTHAWTGLVAQPGLPHYVAMFTWTTTFGSFRLAVIYLLLSLGALRGLHAHADSWKVWLAGTVGGLATAVGLFGAIYKVTAPTVYAPYAALGVLVLAFVATAGTHQRASGARESLLVVPQPTPAAVSA